MMRKVVLQTQNLSIGYTHPVHTVATGLNLSLHSGELVCLIGPNGAGKSTLMRTLAGMQPPLQGQALLLGEDVARLPSRQLAQRLSIVLTDRVDVGALSGYALVALGRHPYTDWTGNLSKEDERIIREAVSAVGGHNLGARPMNQLSDGERQKFMIARALAQQPAVMLLDEPTAFLDLPRRVEIMQLLRALAREADRAILLSTHDLDLALRMADRLWLMPKAAPMQTGTPEDLVLNGAFERAFASEGVRFDPRTGTFVSYQEDAAPISVEGQGLRFIWLRRALERAGYSIVHDAPTRVCATDDTFLLQGVGDPQQYDTIEALLQALNSYKDQIT